MVRSRLMCALLLAVTGGFMHAVLAQDTQTSWTQLPPITSLAAPAVSAHPVQADRNLYVAAVSFTGLVAVTATDAPGPWPPWTILGPPPCSPQPCYDQAFYGDPNTQPVFVRDGTTLYLFARGKTNDLYMIRKSSTGPWDTDWLRITTDGSVAGRITVAATRPGSVSGPLFTALYTGAASTVQSRQFDASGTQYGTPMIWSGAVEGTVGSNGKDVLVALLRQTQPSLRVVARIDAPLGLWQDIGPVNAQGSRSAFYEISNVVFQDAALHAAYAFRYLCDDVTMTYCYAVNHMAVPISTMAPAIMGTVLYYTPGTGFRHVLPELISYRNRLVMGYTDPQGQVRYSRWDTSDSWNPWVREDPVAPGGLTDFRPALGALNAWTSATDPNLAFPEFGNDLFAAVSESASQQVSYVNFSRAALTHEFDEQIAIYNSNDRPGTLCLHDPTDATLEPDAFSDGRPVMSEIGFDLWMLPDWFSSHLFKNGAEYTCLLGGNTSGRFDPPCDAARYPVILKAGGGIFVCDGAWVNVGSDYLSVWEELGHSTASGLGFNDDPSIDPTSVNETLTGIPLSDLTAGASIFLERTRSDQQCSPPYGAGPSGRCYGFTGAKGNNYDVGSRQHSFIYPVLYYIFDGDLLRGWIYEDLAVGDDLLWRKYEWIRQSIFHGVEFLHNADPARPWDVDCAPETPLTCGETVTGNNASGRRDLDFWPCNGFDYSGPEVTYALRAPADTDVLVSLTGLTADLDLLATGPSAAGCDSSNCFASSTNAGTSSESLSFSLTAGEVIYVTVDGYAGSQSAYSLNVSCASPTPGDVSAMTPLDVRWNPDGTDLDLMWGESCDATGTDFAVYEGTIGSWDSHLPRLCSTGGETFATITPGSGDRYYLVVPQNGVVEGSYGESDILGERQASGSACLPQEIMATCH